MNYDEFTLLDCVALYEFKGATILIENGHITELIQNGRWDEN